MRSRPLRFASAALLALGLAACGHDTPGPVPSPSTGAPSSVSDDDARADLAGQATVAQDHAQAALYSLDDGSGQARNVVATTAADGTWRVDVSRGALNGTADVSIVGTKAGTDQCTLSTAQQPITPTCVRIAAAGRAVPDDTTPPVEALFHPVLDVFTDRTAPLSVAKVQPLSGAQGTCYSVDSIAASLSAPVDVGIYCYSDTGLLTAARVNLGTLTLVSTGAGPATVALPGPEVQGQPMSIASGAAIAPPPSALPSSLPPAQ